MVILGGLEVLAAGYLYHKHEQNKKERQRLAEEDAALEDEVRRLEDQQHQHQHRHHKSPARSSDHYLAVPGGSRADPGKGRRHRRDHSAPPGQPYRGGSPSMPLRPARGSGYGSPPAIVPVMAPMSPPPSAGLVGSPMSPPPAYSEPVTGWPAHWGPPPPPPPPPPATPTTTYELAGSPGGAAMPPTPPIEYGWKPGMSYGTPPTETSDAREARRAERRARRAQRTHSEERAGESSGRHSSRRQGMPLPLPSSQPATKPKQRVRFYGMSEGMEAPSARRDGIFSGRGHRWEGGGGEGGGGGGGGGGGC